MTERQVNVLRDKNRNLDKQLAGLSGNNQRLVALLETTREQIITLKAALEKDGDTPFSYGTVVAKHPRQHPEPGSGIESTGAQAVDVIYSGRKMRVAVSPLMDFDSVLVGQQVLLNEALVVVAALGFEETGELVTVKELLENNLAVVMARADDQRVIELADPLRKTHLRVGDQLTVDSRSGMAVSRVQLTDMQSLVLEEVPEISYSDIGGLNSQIEAIKDSVELPFTHPELYREHGLSAPKGILLYGPPGCGKTLIAKAVAHSLAQRVVERKEGTSTRSYFLNIKGPELLDKYVGETERHIRLIFARAREKALHGDPVVVFFDEMEALFRTRGTGVSSDVETTIVPQLLAEIDGVERLDNVIVIGASNREDMIDPAILRPGRLDVKIKIRRPDAQGATEIFSKYLTTDLPLHETELAADHNNSDATIRRMIDSTVAEMYSTERINEFLEVTYVTGQSEILYFKDFASGAVIHNIVDRAKKHAIKALITSGERGLKQEYLLRAVREEFAEHEDMPNTTNPDDWARISGRKGERISNIRSLVNRQAAS
ncbi:proteasome ATPase [Glutamicibacter mishrai]|uniref:AAA ATPase forming ring-shaped complexes n=1 Tax=Glutamicibacter mishrai TaxID=1775880 RepID=A0A6H0SN28_9MICC|nr:proteasome ATPase [Glutamicibacter mishrai]QIV88833.1 proteasome ATPase [Glutamicibacter mishrai]UTT41388.1 proteasome ATPase [Glutamicibacter mishrai]